MFAEETPSSTIKIKERELAAAYIEAICHPEPWDSGIPVPEEYDETEYDQKRLALLGQPGWEAAYDAWRNGRTYLPDVLEKAFHPNADALMIELLQDESSKFRPMIVRAIGNRSSKKCHELLRPFAKDKNADVRREVFIALDPLRADKEDIVTAVDGLADEARSVRFQAHYFLVDSTANVIISDGNVDVSKTSWSNWWAANYATPRGELVKTGLKRCAELLTHPKEEVRSLAESALLMNSGQLNYGRQNTWRGSSRGEPSKRAWLDWHSLAYGNRLNSMHPTSNEQGFALENPDIPLPLLWATVSMNVRDLDSQFGLVRSMARTSIVHALGEACPFRIDPPDNDGDHLNTAIKSWWASRLSANQK